VRRAADAVSRKRRRLLNFSVSRKERLENFMKTFSFGAREYGVMQFAYAVDNIQTGCANTRGAIAATDVLKWSEAQSDHAHGLGENIKQFFQESRDQN
jgi:hypothetical protein